MPATCSPSARPAVRLPAGGRDGPVGVLGGRLLITPPPTPRTTRPARPPPAAALRRQGRRRRRRRQCYQCRLPPPSLPTTRACSWWRRRGRLAATLRPLPPLAQPARRPPASGRGGKVGMPPHRPKVPGGKPTQHSRSLCLVQGPFDTGGLAPQAACSFARGARVCPRGSLRTRARQQHPVLGCAHSPSQTLFDQPVPPATPLPPSLRACRGRTSVGCG